jgi:hypothetical protein
MRRTDEILQKAKRLRPAERRKIAMALLRQLERRSRPAKRRKASGMGPYARWLAAAGSVRSEFRDLSTEKYRHVAASSTNGRSGA